MHRTEIADFIAARLEPQVEALRRAWLSSGPIRYFAIDDLLPEDLARRLRAAFPPPEAMQIKRSLRELKFVAAQMDRYDPLLEESIFAFQDPRVVDLVARITGLRQLEPDDKLYAGGISMMVQGHFLNPHVDNSHDLARERYRVLNLLYYVSPDWQLANGGHLELWPKGPKGEQVTIESRFNRLAVMMTDQTSWHSVSPVQAAQSRCCVSNYYFSTQSPESAEYYHVTSFRGRPEQKMRDLVLRADIALRTFIRTRFPNAFANKHFYDRKP